MAVTFGLLVASAPLLGLAADEEEEAPTRPQFTAEEADAAAQHLLESDKYSRKGADTCLKCHDEDNVPPIFPIFKTKHAVLADARTPFAHHQCETCHGPGDEHATARVKGDELRPPMLNFGVKAWTPVRVQNGKCLECHQTHQRIEWKGSVHEFNDVPCAGCHTIHVADDPVLERSQQPAVCYKCHARERAQFYQFSHHPVREGQMACTECHNVHGGKGADLLVKADVREKCTSCHAEKRGPFLWEHPPVAEDCMLCHRPHGSSQPALLTKRPPMLCQECHSQDDHPSVQYDGSTVPPLGLGSRFVVLRACLNCHSQVHGSNHPSGVTLAR